MRLRKVAWFAALTVATHPAVAQQLRGVVRDSGSVIPVPGAVVMALDSAGNVLGRSISDDAGHYYVATRGAPKRIQVVRIGFRPRTVALPAGAGDPTGFDINLSAIPTLLEHVQIVANRSQCPARPDAAATLGLIDQARAGLLATVVARETNPATVTRLTFNRVLDANGVLPVHQSVHMESADRATVSFNAAQPAVDFARRGFASDSGGRRTFLGPDADVLLDDGFASGYCFHIAETDRSHPNLVGLAFTPASRRGGRVDIVGALWVDTVARRLSHVEFRYLGLDEVSQGFGSGGRVSFREVSPGLTLIDRWSLRLLGSPDTTDAGAHGQAASRTYQISEIGGELATASWPDGRSWTAPLGTLRLAARTRDGAPATGTVVGLFDTDYRATVDSVGRAEFRYLVPGPYSTVVIDPRLATIGVTLPTDLAFTAARDSVIAEQLQVPTAEDFVGTLCRASERAAGERAAGERAVGERAVGDAAWIIARVGTADGRAVPNSRWRIARSGKGGWIPVSEGRSTGSSGLFSYCRNISVGQTVQVEAWRENDAPAVVVRRLTRRLTVLPILMPIAVTRRGRAAGVAADFVGTVLDSTSGTGVAGAFVALVGTSLTAITDSAGAFSISGVPPGDYAAEIRTAALDAVGAVGRSDVQFISAAEPVRLYVPTMDQLVAAMCGPSAGEGTGIIIGNVQLTGSGPAPNGVRLVAEWTETGAAGATSATTQNVGRTQWMHTRTDEHGTYRLCGVPTNTAIIVRTQADSGVDAAAQPATVQFAAGRRFARLDLTMQNGLAIGAAFAGLVVADSTESPIAGAEIALTDLNRTVVSNRTGGFRLSDIPPGTHHVVLRRPGFVSITADLTFVSNQTIEHRIVLGREAAAPTTVAATGAASVNPSFDEHRKSGLGTFLTLADIEKHPGRTLSDVLGTVPELGSVVENGSSHGWIVGKRPSTTLTPSSTDDVRNKGFYCPMSTIEQSQGITCACYAQVYVDGSLMNRQRPTEPFDLNSIASERIDGVEWYASPSQTPAQYGSLNSPCGVMVIWTRARGHHF